jgi:MATE family multidrug resistance protein
MFGQLKRTFLLALPISSGHVSQMALSLADTLMIGKVGVVSLAGAAFANTLHHFMLITGFGLMSSVSILVAHAYGANRFKEAGEVLRRGLVMGVVGGFILFFAQWALFPFLSHLGQPPEVLEESWSYLWLLSASMPFVFAGSAFKNFAEALNRPWPAFWCGLFAVILNVFLNWVLIYGNLGAPELGLTGAGVATFLSRLANLLFLYIWLRLDARFHPMWPVEWFKSVPLQGLYTLFKLGFPVGLQLLMEIGAFGSVTLLMGWIGVVEMAAHQIAITCAATTFMIPLGVSMAVAIRVGHSVGSGYSSESRLIGFSAVGAGIILSILSAALFIVFDKQLASLFTEDPNTRLVAASLIRIAGLFQIFDGIQVIAMGALRGCKDVRVPTVIVFCAYWLLAIPIGALLGFNAHLGAPGLWYGLMIGLGIAAAGLLWRFNAICGNSTG